MKKFMNICGIALLVVLCGLSLSTVEIEMGHSLNTQVNIEFPRFYPVVEIEYEGYKQ